VAVVSFWFFLFVVGFHRCFTVGLFVSLLIVLVLVVSGFRWLLSRFSESFKRFTGGCYLLLFGLFGWGFLLEFPSLILIVLVFFFVFTHSVAVACLWGFSWFFVVFSGRGPTLSCVPAVSYVC
jgi:hypothetical protein